uniref:Uncharacterized protein n=1 Tax=Vitrella brassicaformis TaxID=1169539 RepID=A0A7S1NYR1_9ALVE|mmetsp:Transcript_16314/g.39067  ORF Transcript_16314/g.39067 Transcript_16314/m.39067 type:complete len:118 (+) Transcript_16314:2087-2440(+)
MNARMTFWFRRRFHFPDPRKVPSRDSWSRMKDDRRSLGGRSGGAGAAVAAVAAAGAVAVATAEDELGKLILLPATSKLMAATSRRSNRSENFIAGIRDAADWLLVTETAEEGGGNTA